VGHPKAIVGQLNKEWLLWVCGFLADCRVGGVGIKVSGCGSGSEGLKKQSDNAADCYGVL